MFNSPIVPRLFVAITIAVVAGCFNSTERTARETVARARSSAALELGGTSLPVLDGRSNTVLVSPEVRECAQVDLAYGILPEAKELAPGTFVFGVTMEDAHGAAILAESFEAGIDSGRSALGSWRHKKRLYSDLGPAVSALRLSIDYDGPWNGSEKLAPEDLAFWAAPTIQAAQGKPWTNLILISLDTLRNDHLGYMGYARNTSPNIDAFARTGVHFRTCITQSPWTLPAHYSMLTGLLPTNHGAVKPIPAAITSGTHGLLTLSVLLEQEGYHTVAFTAGGYMSDAFGFQVGFDSYEVTSRSPENEGSDIEENMSKTLAWLRNGPSTPFFLFFHTYEVHYPYQDTRFLQEHESEDLTVAERRTLLYDGDIARTDMYVGELLRAVDELGLAESTLVVITSDHGEDLSGDRLPEDADFHSGHGYELYDRAILVPWVMRGPGLPANPEGIPYQVRQIDMFPTLAELLGIPLASAVDGRSCAGMIFGHDQFHRPAISEAMAYGPHQRSVRYDKSKFIYASATGKVSEHNVGQIPPMQFYDLERDPSEKDNLLQGTSEAYDSSLGVTRDEGPVPDIPEDVQEQLKNLGYIE